MMQPDHVTLRDETLAHQVVLFKPAKSNQVMVSCNCLIILHEHGGSPSYKSMGPTASLEESRRLYNDPKNHNGVPFTEGDRAKW